MCAGVDVVQWVQPLTRRDISNLPSSPPDQNRILTHGSVSSPDADHVAAAQADLRPSLAVDERDLAHRHSRRSRQPLLVDLALPSVVLPGVLLGCLPPHVLIG